MAPHLTNEEFFNALSSLLSTTSQRSRGSVYLTQKQLSAKVSLASSPLPPVSFDGEVVENASAATTITPSILIRATDGRTSNPNPLTSNDGGKSKSSKASKSPKSSGRTREGKVKLSTVVSPQDLEAFYARYADVCKTGMMGLKKRDRSAKKRGKAKKGQVGGATAGVGENTKATKATKG